MSEVFRFSWYIHFFSISCSMIPQPRTSIQSSWYLISSSQDGWVNGKYAPTHRVSTPENKLHAIWIWPLWFRPSIKKSCLVYSYLSTFNNSTQNIFGTSGKWNFFCPIFTRKSQFSHYGAMKEKNNMFFSLPTYPTKKYRVGVHQTNNFLRMDLS